MYEKAIARKFVKARYFKVIEVGSVIRTLSLNEK